MHHWSSASVLIGMWNTQVALQYRIVFVLFTQYHPDRR